MACAIAQGQDLPPSRLVETGHVLVEGRSTPYLIHRLPVSSFPDLPEPFATQLNDRGCLIPQSYGAHHPENVVHASLEHAGSSDWAVLCSAQGKVSLLVYFASEPSQVKVLATAAETGRLQVHDPSGVLGFDWAIDPASPQRVRENQRGMGQPLLDHDSLVDSVLEGRAVYRYYRQGAWTILDMPE